MILHVATQHFLMKTPAFKALFTWKEGNSPTRVTLLGWLPSSIVFAGFVHKPAKATLGGGSPYLLGSVTLPGGLTFLLCKRRK